MKRFLLTVAAILVAMCGALAPAWAQGGTIGGSTGGVTATTIFDSIRVANLIRFTGTTSSITGGAGNMTILAGTGANRTLSLGGTAAGGVPDTTLTLFADDSLKVFGQLHVGPNSSIIRGGLGDMQITAGTGVNRQLVLQTTTSAGTAKNTLVLGADSSATFLGTATAPRFLATDTVRFTSSNGFLYGTGSLVIRPGTSAANTTFLRNGSNQNVIRILSDTAMLDAKVKASTLTAAAGTPNTVCINATTKEITENAATSCVVSSARFKRNIIPLSDVVAQRITTQLKPATFVYRDGGRAAIGLIAEQADSVDYRLATRDSKGRINSVNYEQVTVVLLKQVQGLTAKLDRLCKAGIREAC